MSNLASAESSSPGGALKMVDVGGWANGHWNNAKGEVFNSCKAEVKSQTSGAMGTAIGTGGAARGMRVDTCMGPYAGIQK
eukprot:CAMPEP_0172784062 /NCGR_PEP_ID=MMETSP1074-20121228/204753_1 /TAXON_ID=2916 /ORGANISM="Ceratium fusus, Strain PA161109" /LENGTH=79 /DNA_ID=CAMNT_0013621061 /DNA_START=147 /DNA_END=386 /DNA_ORIENTATION=-